MSFMKKDKATGRKAAWTILLAIAILLAFQAAAAARPLGTFQNLTTPNGQDDTMPDMKVGSDNAAHIVYQAYDGTDNDIFYQTNTSGSWVTTRLTNDSLNDIYPKLQLDGNDRAHVTWSHWDGSDYEIYYANNTSGSWVTSAVTNNAVDDTRPSIDMNDSPTLYGVTAYDVNTAWAVGAEGTIIKTINGGTTWAQQNSGVENVLKGVGVAMTDANRVWAVGDAGTIRKTNDGGTTWGAQTSGTSENLYDVAVVNANVAWAVGASSVVLFTNDGGTTWNPQSSPVASNFNAVSAVDANVAWAVGDSGIIIYTIDAGTTWNQQATGGITEALTGVAAVNANIAWAVGEGGLIYYTNDAGTTWGTNVSGTETDFNHVAAASASKAYAVGASGAIYETADGGTTWNERDTGFRTQLYGIDTAGASDAWAVGQGTLIFHTTTGGTSWTSQDFSITGYVWIAYETFDAASRRSVLQVNTNLDGSWKPVYGLDMAAAIKRPSLAISSDGSVGHLSFIIQDSSYWRLYYVIFDAQAGSWAGGIGVTDTVSNETNPSIELDGDSPMIAFEAWNDNSMSYDIFVARLSGGAFNIVQVTESGDNEYSPIINRNPFSNEISIGFQAYTGSKDYYPGLSRYDSTNNEWAVDTYTDVTSKVASRAVGIVANDGFHVHLCYAGQDPDLDIYYGYLTPNPWIYAVDPVKGYPQTSNYLASPGAPGDSIFLYGTDFGVMGEVYMHRLENGVDKEALALIRDWNSMMIEVSTPQYNYVNLKPVNGPIRVRSYGKNSNTDKTFLPIYPTVTKLTPNTGWPYDIIGIEGTGFNDVQDESVVYYGYGYATSGSSSYYPEWTDTLIKSKVPVVASQGDLNVRIKGAGAAGGEHDIYAVPPSDFTLIQSDVDWYFAEGYTGTGFQEYLCVLNPNDVEVKIKVNFILENAENNFAKEYAIQAHQRFTLSVNGEAPDSNVSLRVASSGRVICERPMYFNYRGVWTGGHNVMGANQPSNEWYFAEGTTRAGFDEWLCIMNPDSERDAKVNVSYMNATGEVKVKEYGVPKSSRFTVDVNGEVGADQDISIKVVSTGAAVVVERPMYFNYADAWTGGHITMGAQKLASHWYFAEGTTRSNFDEWLCIGNPGSEATTATVTYYIAGQKDPVVQPYEVAAHSRYTVKVNDAIGPEKDVSISVVTDKPTVVERPMYFNYGGSWTGGHDVIGSNFITEGWYLAEGTNRAGFEEWLCLLNPSEADCSVGVSYILGTGETIDKTYTVGAKQRYTVFVNSEVPPDSDISIIVTSSLPILVERPMYFDYQGWTGGHDVVGYSPIYIMP
jgi:photosystem II stability/assembly factor-like uncharacterized protein